MEDFHGDFMTFLSWVSDCFGTQQETPGWYGILARNSGAVMLVPSAGAVVTVRHDQDGAQVRLEVACEAHAARRNRLEESYRRRWGSWLDEDVILSEQQIEEGVREVEAALEERRTQEARGEATYGRAH